MLSRSQVKTILMLRRRGDSLFSKLPIELIPVIKHLPTPEQDFLDALHDAAFGKLEELKAKLESAKSNKDVLKKLLLQAGDIVTPSGLAVKGKTLLECALGAGDMEMAAMIMPYFDEFEGGKSERKSQFEPYRPCIEAIETQKPDEDLTWLFDIIKKSSWADVAKELEYDPNYQSELRDALNKFRSEKLDPKRRIITKPRMHCNYQNFIDANNILYREWDNLREDGGANYDKHRLVVRQVLGFIELVEFPAYERYVFAGGQFEKAIAGKEIRRTFHYLYPGAAGREESFPLYDHIAINRHSGVGFKSFVCVKGSVGGLRPTGPDVVERELREFTELMSSKSNQGQEIYKALVLLQLSEPFYPQLKA